MISNRRLYTDNSQTLILEEDDIRVAWLLVAANAPYSKTAPLFGLNIDQYLRKYPTKQDAPPPYKGEAQTTDEDDDMQNDAQTKSVTAPAQTKAVQPDKTKGKGK